MRPAKQSHDRQPEPALRPAGRTATACVPGAAPGVGSPTITAVGVLATVRGASVAPTAIAGRIEPA